MEPLAYGSTVDALLQALKFECSGSVFRIHGVVPALDRIRASTTSVSSPLVPWGPVEYIDLEAEAEVKWSQVVRLGYLGSDEELGTVPVGVQDDQGRSLVLPWKLTSFSSAYSPESMQVTVRLMAPGQQMHTEESELESELESRQDNGFD